ncbi:ABC-2 type transport system permease protein [Promicromonospora umidemergens]|uniref:Transport permease protein n=1 Tax=Promicromonospora umidemergens TaxID=629679 RepID=A0ABP8XMG9_9MICO|nr:ABC transporter permease [Promicromonospora umidemergens]MCP2282120.1 ABC-2 type transport system permease protein [Promicromonospora umidemergens]
MSTTYVVRDSMTMLRRNLRHLSRYPSLALMLLAVPIVFLLMFVYVFGGTLGAGLPVDGGGTRADYLTYLVPGIWIMTVASVANGTAVSVAIDRTGGMFARFRTMDIARVSVLTGHVLGAVTRTLLALSVMIVFALLLGFRSDAGFVGWLGAAGLVLLLAFSFTWLTVAMGLAAGSIETASNTPLVLMVLPFVSSGFVPTEQMPAGLRHFAEHQPFTPIIETLRALTAGTPVGHEGWIAVGWCTVIGVTGYLWARRQFARVPVR